ncbi:MAG: FG-GAP repeat domain-containing protein [Nitrospiria bacterium]
MVEGRKILSLLVLTVFAWLPLGCSDSGSDLPIKVTVNPEFFRIPEGGTVRFSATVSGTLDKSVTWSLNGPGAIDPQTGQYASIVGGQAASATITAINQASGVAGNGGVGITKFKKLFGEPVLGVDELAVGGLSVRGQSVDLNGDGILDLIAQDRSGNQVTVFGGLGDEAKFLPNLISVNDPVAMVVGDFIPTGGFLADLAVASGLEKKITFYQAVSNTIWKDQPPLISLGDVSVSPNTPVSLTTGRFHDNNETDIVISDLIVGTDNNEIVVFLQDRQFSGLKLDPGITRGVGGKPIQMISTDFDLDGSIDLAVVREGVSDLLILFGDGSGGFPSSGTVSFSTALTDLATADFNGDGVRDLVGGHAENQISVLLGNGDGTFGPPQFIPLSSAPGQIAIGDFNVGEFDDIAVALPAENALFLLFGDGEGNLIGDWRFDTGLGSLTSLISGFFTGFQAPQGDQSIELVYLGFDSMGSTDRFFLLRNQAISRISF